MWLLHFRRYIYLLLSRRPGGFTSRSLRFLEMFLEMMSLFAFSVSIHFLDLIRVILRVAFYCPCWAGACFIPERRVAFLLRLGWNFEHFAQSTAKHHCLSKGSIKPCLSGWMSSPGKDHRPYAVRSVSMSVSLELTTVQPVRHVLPEGMQEVGHKELLEYTSFDA